LSAKLLQKYRYRGAPLYRRAVGTKAIYPFVFAQFRTQTAAQLR
jgi:hypothetical protein